MSLAEIGIRVTGLTSRHIQMAQGKGMQLAWDNIDGTEAHHWSIATVTTNGQTFYPQIVHPSFGRVGSFVIVVPELRSLVIGVSGQVTIEGNHVYEFNVGTGEVADLGVIDTDAPPPEPVPPPPTGILERIEQFVKENPYAVAGGVGLLVVLRMLGAGRRGGIL